MKILTLSPSIFFAFTIYTSPILKIKIDMRLTKIKITNTKTDPITGNIFASLSVWVIY